MFKTIFTVIATLSAAAMLGSSSYAKDLSQHTLQTDAGQSFDVWVGGPNRSDKAIILVHDWFGITEFTRDTAKRLSKKGYRTYIVDLYDGHSAITHKDAWALMKVLDSDIVDAKINATLAHAQKTDRKIALFAFSMGVSHALNATVANEEIAAAAFWYGDTVLSPEQLSEVSAPLLVVEGSKDGDAAKEAAAFSNAADAADVSVETYVYPGAAHAFAQPLFNQGKTYDAEGAEAAWTVTESFFARKLVPSE